MMNVYIIVPLVLPAREHPLGPYWESPLEWNQAERIHFVDRLLVEVEVLRWEVLRVV